MRERDPGDAHPLSADEMAARSQELVRRCGEVLHGHGPDIQGAALADLLALWLAGHVGPDADQMREQLLIEHIKVVRALIPVNEKIVLARVQAGGSA